MGSGRRSDPGRPGCPAGPGEPHCEYGLEPCQQCRRSARRQPAAHGTGGKRARRAGPGPGDSHPVFRQPERQFGLGGQHRGLQRPGHDRLRSAGAVGPGRRQPAGDRGRHGHRHHLRGQHRRQHDLGDQRANLQRGEFLWLRAGTSQHQGPGRADSPGREPGHQHHLRGQHRRQLLWDNRHRLGHQRGHLQRGPALGLRPDAADGDSRRRSRTPSPSTRPPTPSTSPTTAAPTRAILSR